MADDVGYVEGLSGEEIITDVCSQIADKLRRDCNLRPSDSYQGGYSAKITIRLELYGMDTTEVSAEVLSGQPHPDRPSDHREIDIKIPVEPALDQVRERSDQPIPTLTIDTAGEPLIRPRRYVRPDQMGAATGDKL